MDGFDKVFVRVAFDLKIKIFGCIIRNQHNFASLNSLYFRSRILIKDFNNRQVSPFSISLLLTSRAFATATRRN